MIEIGIADLLADPMQYDGKQVAVVGWFIYEREHVAIYRSPDDRKSTPRIGMWVVHPATLGGHSAVAALSRGWVRIVGRFDNRRKSGCGHFRGWSAQISDLKELNKADPPSENSK
jgi:hypothetical protein